MLFKLMENIKKINNISQKKNKYSALFITNYLCDKNTFLFNSIKENKNFIYANCEIGDLKDIETAIKQIDGYLDYIILDANIFDQVIITNTVSNISIYNDEKCWADSVLSLLFSYRKRKQFNKVLIGGDSPLLNRILKDIVSISKEVYSLDNLSHIDSAITQLDKEQLMNIQFDVVISTALKNVYFDDSFLKYFDYNCFIVDAGIGGFSKKIIQQSYKHQSLMVRMDNRTALSSIFTSIIENDDFIDNIVGEFHYDNIRVVAGGVIGLENDIIVDNISEPTSVIGIANGNGKTLYDIKNDNIKKIEDLLKGD